ncbi:DUF4097 family beta strand repeat-containing protein [Pseudoxanthomonas mexicana]|uniref:DUF4097 family beta strand repeat-containing protein n=1 Tax=Pseudoxanthomonas mexicana TaxID=128785 RepID=UPI00398A6502
MRKTMLIAGLLLPLAAAAQEPQCKHSQPRNLQLDLAGVRTVVFEIGSHDLRVDSRPGASAAVQGRACASNADDLATLRLSQHRSGDTLLIRAENENRAFGFSFGNRYAYLKLEASLPDTVPVQLKVGSGDAVVTGAPALDASVGSGEATARRIRGLTSASVGSGEIELEDIGSLRVSSIGSGEITARQVRGNVEVGGIGSGDFGLDGASGDVKIRSIGSGDAELRNVSGAVRVDSIRSGDLDVRGAASLSVGSIGSGDASHRDVRGAIDLPRKR